MGVFAILGVVVALAVTVGCASSWLRPTCTRQQLDDITDDIANGLYDDDPSGG